MHKKLPVYKKIDTKLLIKYEKNSRTHSDEQIQQLVNSINEFGFTNPLLVDENNLIIAGHARLAAALKLGIDELPCIVMEGLSQAQKKALVIADNKLALNAGWDVDILRDEILDLQEEGFDIELTGFSLDEISDFMVDEVEGQCDPDDVPEPPTEPITKRGDVWILGRHRLLCGDSTMIDDVECLMNGEKADMVFTDPPYNVDYEGYTEENLKIEKDNMSDEEFKQFLADIFASYSIIVKDNASLYVCHGWVCQREFQDALEANGFNVRCQIIWAKSTFGWGFARYKFQHEPIFYCHRKGQSDSWYGDKTQSTLWEVDKPSANKIHPTMKPIELIEMALRNSSKPNDLVVDLFGGSGSTLIACEKTNRKCYMMELAPNYCDVICDRWENYTGKDAILESTGKTFKELNNDKAA